MWIERRHRKHHNCIVKLRRGPRGRPIRQWLDDVKEGTGLSLNEICWDPDDRVAWRMRDSRVATMD